MKDTDLYQHVLGLQEPWSVSKVELDQYCPNVSFPSWCNMLRGFQYRSLPVALPVGQVPQAKRDRETAHTVGSAGQYPNTHLHHPWEGQPHQHFRRSPRGSWSHLRHGSRLTRFCPTPQNASIYGILCHQDQEQFQIQAPLLSPSRQNDWTSMRSDDCAERLLPQKALPRPRRIRFFDAEKDKRIILLTNNFSLPALTIAQLYRCRWQVQLFFKWIKQHLRIKAFYGTSENAVKTQIWIAISVSALVAIVKKCLNLEASLYTMLQSA
jgi:hypothetical protein